MTTSSSAAHRTRRALAGWGIVAGSVLFLAPVAGAERPDATVGGPSARSSTEAGAEREAPARVEGQDSGALAESSGTSGGHEQTICHRTRSARDPYVQITVEFHTADGEVVASDDGHAESHDGPVFDPDTMGDGDTWGDIVPPFTTSDGASYEGKNWPDGGAIFENGCQLPAPSSPGPTGAAADRAPAAPTASPPDVRGDGAEDGGGAEEREGGKREVPDEPAEVDQKVLRTGRATGDIAAVLGHQVTRRGAQGEVVPASDGTPALLASLARTDAGPAVLVMLALGLLAAGYVAVDAIRRRGGGTD